MLSRLDARRRKGDTVVFATVALFARRLTIGAHLGIKGDYVKVLPPAAALRRLAPVFVTLAVLACPPVRAAAAPPAPAPPPGTHITASGPTQLWLSAAGQATLPDPHQPLCTFIWTTTWQRTGYAPDGYDTDLLTRWGNTVTCQAGLSSRLAVHDELYDPWHHLMGVSDNACAACSGPLSAFIPATNCNPCHIWGTPFDYQGQHLRNEGYEMDSFYTVVFTVPLLNTYEWATVGESETHNQACSGPPSALNGDPYTWGPCGQAIMWIPKAKKGDGNASFTTSGNGESTEYTPVAPLGPAEATPLPTRPPAQGSAPRPLAEAATEPRPLPFTDGLSAAPAAPALAPLAVLVMAGGLRRHRRAGLAGRARPRRHPAYPLVSRRG
jgi:hypothetical protein